MKQALVESEVGAVKRAATHAGYKTQVASNADGAIVGVLVNGADDAAYVMDAITAELEESDVAILFETFPLPRYLMHVYVTPVDVDEEEADR